MNRVLEIVRSPRTALALVILSAGWAASAQQPATPRAPIPVTTNFTGTVANLDASDVRSVRFQYAAGARSHWHSHTGVQVLIAEQGQGRAQVKGQKMEKLRPGKPVQLPAGIAHWHGAEPNQGLTQIATTVGGATWLGAVSDEEYAGAK